MRPCLPYAVKPEGSWQLNGVQLFGRLIAHTVNAFGRDLLVIGNTGSNATREAVHATEQGFNVGMHAALQINPYYGKTSHSGLLNHFRAVLAEGPGILYNVPGRTGQDIPDDIVHELSAHANFLGIKECTGNQRIEVGLRCMLAFPASCKPTEADGGLVCTRPMQGAAFCAGQAMTTKRTPHAMPTAPRVSSP